MLLCSLSAALCALAVPFRVHVAPLQGYTDQHLRALLRPLFPSATLWTEMEKAEDLLANGAERLRHPGERGPLVLQLGGSDPSMLARAVRTAGIWDEFNLNAGCPSIETGGASYGASLMRGAVSMPNSTSHDAAPN